MTDNASLTDPDPLQTLWDDDTRMDKLARLAVQDAVQKHKQNGESIVIWQDGQIVTLAPHQIPDPEPG